MRPHSRPTREADWLVALMNSRPALPALPTTLGGVDWRTLLPGCLHKARASSPADPAAGELLLQFTASARAVHDGFMRIFGPGGFSDHKFTVLVVLLALHPAASTPSELAAHAAITRASMTEVLDALDRRGWIARRRDPANRRTQRVTLTALGRRAVTQAAALYLQIADDLVRPLAPADLAAFGRVCAFLQSAGKALPGAHPLFQPSTST